MAKKIRGFLAGSSYAPTVSSDEGLLRQGCKAIQDSGISSALVLMEDDSLWIGYPTYELAPAGPVLITNLIRERLMQDDFATRPIRSAIRAQLKEIEGKTPREQLAVLAQILQAHAEYFLVDAGADMNDTMRRREAELDATCEREAA